MKFINPTIRITEGEDVGERLSLNDFLALNEFEADEADAIRSSLFDTGSYTGGGGAAPVWSVEIEKQAPAPRMLACDQGSPDLMYARLEREKERDLGAFITPLDQEYQFSKY